MRKFKESIIFNKKIKKIRGQELINLSQKLKEILTIEHLNHYKNLRTPLQKFKRVHINNSYVILFFDEQNIVYFVDYDHHDIIYKYKKKDLKKYLNYEYK